MEGLNWVIVGGWKGERERDGVQINLSVGVVILRDGEEKKSRWMDRGMGVGGLCIWGFGGLKG